MSALPPKADMGVWSKKPSFVLVPFSVHGCFFPKKGRSFPKPQIGGQCRQAAPATLKRARKSPTRGRGQGVTVMPGKKAASLRGGRGAARLMTAIVLEAVNGWEPLTPSILGRLDQIQFFPALGTEPVLPEMSALLYTCQCPLMAISGLFPEG